MRTLRSNAIFAAISIASLVALIFAVTLLGPAVRWSLVGVLGVTYVAVVAVSLAHGRREARRFVIRYLTSSRTGFALEASVMAQGARAGFSERELQRAARQVCEDAGGGAWTLATLANVAPEAHAAAMEDLHRPVAPAMPETASAETQRLEELYALELLDTGAEPPYEELVATARAIFESPIVAINFIDRDRQWTKAGYGLTASSCPRTDSFCSHTISQSSGAMVINDARTDARFATMSVVTGAPDIRSYAGVTIYGPTGEPVGAICIADDETDAFRGRDLASLHELAAEATSLLALRARELQAR